MSDTGERNGSGLRVRVEPGRPAIVELAEMDGMDAAVEWLRTHLDAVRHELRTRGNIMLRGLPITTVEDFAAVRDIVLSRNAEHSREETTRRTDFGNGLYSATDLPPLQTIRLHCEDSYSTVVPGVLLFCCLVPPAEGGATTLGDMRAVLRALPPALVERFRRDGWAVVRNFQPHLGVSWQEAFDTDDREAVAEYCARHDLTCRWLSGDWLRTGGRRSATLRHPVTGEESWFNHVAVFNEWTHDAETRELLLGLGRENLPQNTFHGDGSPIDRADMNLINRVMDDVLVREPWRRGDLLLVDNLLCAHGREPYAGDRRVLVAMGEAVRVGECRPSGPIGPATAAV